MRELGLFVRVDLGQQKLAVILNGHAIAEEAVVYPALARIGNGTYGICEDTGRPIGLKRLEAQPTATLSVEALEKRERAQR